MKKFLTGILAAIILVTALSPIAEARMLYLGSVVSGIGIQAGVATCTGTI